MVGLAEAHDQGLLRGDRVPVDGVVPNSTVHVIIGFLGIRALDCSVPSWTRSTTAYVNNGDKIEHGTKLFIRSDEFATWLAPRAEAGPASA